MAGAQEGYVRVGHPSSRRKSIWTLKIMIRNISDSPFIMSSVTAPPIVPTVTGRRRSTADAPNPRKRGRTACTRCKNRKQKCDDQWPNCSNCQKAGIGCDKTTVTEDEPPAAYTRALEGRVAFLESRLKLVNGAHPVEEAQQPPTSPNDPPRTNALGEVAELISMGNFEAPAYIGNSSGLSLALNLGEIVQATVWNKALPVPPESPDVNRARRDIAASPTYKSGLGNRSRVITMKELAANSAEPPTDELGRDILGAYFSQLHSRYPFLDPDEVYRLHEDRINLASTPVTNLTKPQRYGIFKLYMVYAIGAMLLQLTEKYTSSPPESYYSSALQHITAARESRTIQNVEAMTLLVMYHLRSLSSLGIWYMIGLAMRTSIDLGLHRKGYEVNYDPSTVQMRRRLFWSVYSLERNIAISMGRPFSIADRQIDVALPTDYTEIGIYDAPPPSIGSSNSPNRTAPLTSAIYLFRLRQIESRIQHSIYRADKPLASLQPKMTRFYTDLEDWKQSLTDRLGGSDLQYPMLHYHSAVRLLVQPFLALLPPNDPYYALCMRAAGDICQAHKRLHQTLDCGHSFIAVQTVFVSGLTLLYGLWTQTHAVWSVALANDIRACSLVLFIMGERASWVGKYRDAFELLVNAAMEKLQSGDGRLTEKAAAQVSGGGDGAGTRTGRETWSGQIHQGGMGEEQEAWRVVAELASWIDQGEGSPVWMPDFEMLQNLSHA
ncbi:putative C6 transcription factor [Pseudomassariella vexata]|uniref:Putative C6 transcription factor n=1 Tax=Pseudomassariella vexata TaxID=1141098 RepID=A0A1Y2EE18_9PEZI|nr:putative C6 transcription factor [Pseudomassariella vexata]ORY69823.1 putative C6 transcription factor [Pseudomassariella vexata]